MVQPEFGHLSLTSLEQIVCSNPKLPAFSAEGIRDASGSLQFSHDAFLATMTPEGTMSICIEKAMQDAVIEGCLVFELAVQPEDVTMYSCSLASCPLTLTWQVPNSLLTCMAEGVLTDQGNSCRFLLSFIPLLASPLSFSFSLTVLHVGGD